MLQKWSKYGGAASFGGRAFIAAAQSRLIVDVVRGKRKPYAISLTIKVKFQRFSDYTSGSQELYVSQNLVHHHKGG